MPAKYKGTMSFSTGENFYNIVRGLEKARIPHQASVSSAGGRIWFKEKDRVKVNDIVYKVSSGQKNPKTINKGEWQAAHAFRQLSDGRVQILTNPNGKVPKDLSITLKRKYTKHRVR